MIPKTLGDLDLMARESERQVAEVEEILGAYSPEALLRRPDEKKWSASGHLTHMCVVNEGYLATIAERIRRARADGDPESEGPYRHPWFASWFVRSMEPPPKRRLKTMKVMVPDPAIEPEAARRRFATTQGRLLQAIHDARGLDLGRVRFSSPFLRLVRLSLGTGLELLLAHNRRHVWLIREVLGAGGPDDAGSIRR